MKRYRLWMAWVFGGLGHQRLDMAWQRIEALESVVSQQNKLLSAVVTELNDLRNNLPAVLTQAQPPRPVARRAPWREFATAATQATRAQGAPR